MADDAETVRDDLEYLRKCTEGSLKVECDDKVRGGLEDIRDTLVLSIGEKILCKIGGRSVRKRIEDRKVNEALNKADDVWYDADGKCESCESISLWRYDRNRFTQKALDRERERARERDDGRLV